MKVALCQLLSEAGSVGRNAKAVIDAMNRDDADIFVFPEMFLTDYSFRDFDSVKSDVKDALRSILSVTSEKGCTAIVGGPRYSDDGVYNAAYVISNRIAWYDKINLPNFGPFSERETFLGGSRPYMFDVRI